MRVLYGAPPEDDFEKQAKRERNMRALAGATEAEPEAVETTTRNLKERLDWLNRQLGMVDAWKHERDTIQRMLEATKKPRKP